MPLLGTGNNPNQLPTVSHMGGSAFRQTDDDLVQFAPVMSLDQVRGTPGIQSKYIIVDDATVTGLYKYDSSDTSTVDNGIVLKTIDGRRYKPVVIRSGVTASRPNTVGLQTGYQYYDTEIGKPVWWNGSAWKDATGTTV